MDMVSKSARSGEPGQNVRRWSPHTVGMSKEPHMRLKTIYVPCPVEDMQEARESMRSEAEGGIVDLVVKDFNELTTFATEARK